MLIYKQFHGLNCLLADEFILNKLFEVEKLAKSRRQNIHS